MCSLKLWKANDGTRVHTIGHSGRISCVAFSRDSLYVVTGSEDMSLKVWEAATGKLTQVGLSFLLYYYFFSLTSTKPQPLNIALSKV